MQVRSIVASIVVALVLPGAASAWHPHVVYVYDTGHFDVGLVAAGVDGVNLERWPFEANPCHRVLKANVFYDPDRATVDVDGVAEVNVSYRFRVRLLDADGTVLAEGNASTSGATVPLGTVPTAGPYEVRLTLLEGADIDWAFAVNGFAPGFGLEGDVCELRVMVNEIEANPEGDDAGNEWVEILNNKTWSMDLSGWVLRTLDVPPAGVAFHEFPPGTVLGAGERLVVTFPSQALDNENETIVLEQVALGTTLMMDCVRLGPGAPPCPENFVWPGPGNDTANDGRTWQRTPDGWEAWEFASDTRGSANS
ncbi:MAG: lamin tail domain-containing protein [Methanobacteriota archaeon]